MPVKPVTKEPLTVRKFMLKKYPTDKYMDCPVPQHHWETIQEYATEYASQSTAEKDARIKALEGGLGELAKQYEMQGRAYAKEHNLEWERFLEMGLPAYETATQLLAPPEGDK